MSIKERLRNLLFIAAIHVGVLAGAPMRPDEIENFLRLLLQPKMAHTLPMEKEDDDKLR